jgi:hypothetical protein
MDGRSNDNHPGTPPHAAPYTVVTCASPRGGVTLTKGPHRWTFSCEPGGERELLLRLADMARAPGVPFDWFDAALVSHQLRSRLLPGLTREEGPPPPTPPALPTPDARQPRAPAHGPPGRPR